MIATKLEAVRSGAVSTQHTDATVAVPYKGSASAFHKTASSLHLFIRLIVDVQVCIGELFYSRKRLLDCFIGLKSHCYRLDVPSIGANRGGLMVSELIKKDFRLWSTNADRSDRPLQKQSVALKTCVVEVMKNESPTCSIVSPESSIGELASSQACDARLVE